MQATKFFLVEFGCCPDGETNAEGSSLEGCEDCSTSEFGCCPDQFTYATGLDGLGCDCAGKIFLILLSLVSLNIYNEKKYNFLIILSI